MTTINRAFKVLIIDLVGMLLDKNGMPDYSATKAHIEAKGGRFHYGLLVESDNLELGVIHFFYQPSLSTEPELLKATDQGQYDAVIAAATYIPEQAKFDYGGVRIGAGTGNMGSNSWGGGNGIGGVAPLMNTPSFNSRATAQMVMKALLDVLPDLDIQALHDRVVGGNFDTGKNLIQYPTEKLQSKKIAVLGFGNIGREVAKLAKAFAMEVTVYAREHHKQWIVSEGFNYAPSIIEAATSADVISPHLGLGAFDDQTQCFENTGLLNADVFEVMNDGAVLINYDRGELVDINALDGALTSGKIRNAAIDADIFKDPDSIELSGPMVPYLDIHPNHVGKMTLLPHAAADTEHHSRVEGAKQAVNQIFAAITEQKVINLKGDLPEGYNDGKACTVSGVGAVCAKDFSALNIDELTQIAELTAQLSAFWSALAWSKDDEQRAALVESRGAEETKTANTLFTLFAEKGLQGPFKS